MRTQFFTLLLLSNSPVYPFRLPGFGLGLPPLKSDRKLLSVAKNDDLAYKAVTFVKESVFDTLLPLPPSSHSNSRDLLPHLTRFYALETIARTPYFSYLSILHLLESLGIQRRLGSDGKGGNLELMRLHFAEGVNESVHLATIKHCVENLCSAAAVEGTENDENDENNYLGDVLCSVSELPWESLVLARTVSVVWYWIVCFVFLVAPSTAYSINHAVERHAYETYDSFVGEFGVDLAKHPAPEFAVEYYAGKGGCDGLFRDIFGYDNLSSSSPSKTAKVENLRDLFCRIRDDESEHVSAMETLQKPS